MFRRTQEQDRCRSVELQKEKVQIDQWKVDNQKWHANIAAKRASFTNFVEKQTANDREFRKARQEIEKAEVVVEKQEVEKTVNKLYA